MTKKWQNSGATWAEDGLSAAEARLNQAPMYFRDLAAFNSELEGLLPLVLTDPRPAQSGLLAGTLVETRRGWERIETLEPGVSVQTLDGGLARLMGLDRRLMRPGDGASLIRLPGGCLDACSDLMLLPGQHLLIDTLDDPMTGGAPFVLVPAQALLALPGPQRLRPETEIEVLTPMFAEEEGLYVQSGVLFHCPSVIDGAQRYPEDSFFPCLDLDTAQDFLKRRALRLS